MAEATLNDGETLNSDLIGRIRFRCGIAVSAYDEPEIIPLVKDSLTDMLDSGVPQDLIETAYTETPDPRIETALVFYVQANRGSDRSDTTRYLKYYHDKVFKLSLEPDTEAE